MKHSRAAAGVQDNFLPRVKIWALRFPLRQGYGIQGSKKLLTLILGASHEPKKVGIDFQRLTPSHPSPLIPLPVEGRGSRDRQSQLFGRL